MRIKFLDEFAGRKNTFTFEEALEISNLQRNVLWTILSRLEKSGWIERIEKGKYMIIPLGAEKGKYTINEFVIGSLIVKSYAIAYWSALHFYGLTEQIPNTVFIQTTARKKKQEIEVFGVRYRIIRIKERKLFGIRKEWIEETQVNITDKEKTIVDCLDKPQYCGGIIEVAKALKNASFDMKKLSKYARKIGNSGVVRRLGYLCNYLSINIDILPVETRNYLLLDPTMSQKGFKNAWEKSLKHQIKELPDFEEVFSTVFKEVKKMRIEILKNSRKSTENNALRRKNMNEIKVIFKTLTPLWTGDAWGENKEIRPSSIMGSLRFWFEMICYFAGITNESDYKNGKLKADLNDKNFCEKIMSTGSDFENVDKVLAEMGISFPSRIFGCTGWKGWLRIKEIKIKSKERDYKFPNDKISFGELKYKKNEREIIPAWYFEKGFYGTFSIVFELQKKILNSIFYPFLTFIEKYGFLGGKWNIGYGRVKIEKLQENRKDMSNWQNENLKFSQFRTRSNDKYQDKNISDIIHEVDNFDNLMDYSGKNNLINIIKNQTSNKDLREVIKTLITQKSQKRRKDKNNGGNTEIRHLIFGTTKQPPAKDQLPQGTKILPWIYEDENDKDNSGNPRLKGGFISITAIINLE